MNELGNRSGWLGDALHTNYPLKTDCGPADDPVVPGGSVVVSAPLTGAGTAGDPLGLPLELVQDAFGVDLGYWVPLAAV